jgi:hypothetical protein
MLISFLIHSRVYSLWIKNLPLLVHGINGLIDVDSMEEMGIFMHLPILQGELYS